MNIIRRLLALYSDALGVTSVEYGLICALVFLVAMLSFAALGPTLSATMTSAAQSL